MLNYMVARLPTLPDAQLYGGGHLKSGHAVIDSFSQDAQLWRYHLALTAMAERDRHCHAWNRHDVGIWNMFDALSADRAQNL